MTSTLSRRNTGQKRGNELKKGFNNKVVIVIGHFDGSSTTPMKSTCLGWSCVTSAKIKGRSAVK